MKTAEIQIGVLYAVGEGQRDRHRGIVLATDPHRLGMSYSGHRQLWRLQSDPHGRGSGGRRLSVGGERGLPVLLAIPPYRYQEQTLPDLTDAELHELAKQLIADGFTGDELGEDQRIFRDRRARLEVARPQAIERLWVDHLEIERHGREAREAETARRDRVRRLALANHQRVLDLLDELHVDYRPPVSRDGGDDRQPVVGQMSWSELANLLAEVADAVAEPYRDAIDDLLAAGDPDPASAVAAPVARLRELLGPTKFSAAE
jgi:hypothetical protein